ncbi:hypothetical protein JOB18_024418 [Solea senegalensis]|uniref:Uncharacterized protein n=1 Tax=Solea senegalensis TaxID=28829 RepID=A0AAV6QM30_SOLSE|nr:hypothetical protein JOB18_024418 [Solea senegalensis]
MAGEVTLPSCLVSERCSVMLRKVKPALVQKRLHYFCTYRALLFKHWINTLSYGTHHE